MSEGCVREGGRVRAGAANLRKLEFAAALVLLEEFHLHEPGVYLLLQQRHQLLLHHSFRQLGEVDALGGNLSSHTRPDELGSLRA